MGSYEWREGEKGGGESEQQQEQQNQQGWKLNERCWRGVGGRRREEAATAQGQLGTREEAGSRGPTEPHRSLRSTTTS